MAAREVQTGGVRLAMRLWLATGAARSKNTLTRATTATHVASIVTMTFIKREQNEKRGRIGTT